MNVHFFAAARAAAGTASYQVPADFETLGEVLDYLKSNIVGSTAGGMSFEQVLEQCSFLIDGSASDTTASVKGATRLDVLPPFAGG